MSTHRARGGGKSSTRDRASQVVVGVSVAAGKVWAGELENGLDPLCGCTLRQQLPGDPEIHDAPVRLWKAFRNPPSLHPALIDLGGLGGGDRWPAFCNLPAQPLRLPGLVPCVSAGNWIADCSNPSALRANPGWACTIFTQGA